MSKPKILLVDDDEQILALLQYSLTKEGYEVSCTTRGVEALREAEKQPFDLIVLDVMLPDIGGLEICKRLKENVLTQEIPVILVTGCSQETDVLTGLQTGADDYITKPFSAKILVARIKKALQRTSKESTPHSGNIVLHDLRMNPSRHEVLVGGKRISITPTEFRLLHILASRPGSVLTREQITRAAHGTEHTQTSRTIDVQIVSLRKKLGAVGQLIQTVRGVGYSFKE